MNETDSDITTDQLIEYVLKTLRLCSFRLFLVLVMEFYVRTIYDILSRGFALKCLPKDLTCFLIGWSKISINCIMLILYRVLRSMGIRSQDYALGLPFES